mgnify:CR=1 FL=1
MLHSTVAVVGAGGLGGGIIELLARQGVGHIIIIDSDCFSETNLNRQLMSTEKSLGEYKAIIAANRVKQVNSAVMVTPYTERVTPENAHNLLGGARVVVDGLDNLPSRFVVEEAARNLGIPFVYGAVAGFSGQLMTIFPEDKGLSSIFDPSGDLSTQGVELEIGIPSATPAMVMAWQVQEVIKLITGVGKPLRNRLLWLEAEQGTTGVIKLGQKTRKRGEIVSRVGQKASITICFHGLLSLKLAVESLPLEADNCGEALDYLEEKFGPQFREQFHQFRVSRWDAEGKIVTGYVSGRLEDFCLLLLNGRKVDNRNLRQAKLRGGDTLDIFPPSAGG